LRTETQTGVDEEEEQEEAANRANDYASNDARVRRR
jgi:hypothetical protein